MSTSFWTALAGCRTPSGGGTELQIAKTPHLDELAERSSCGMLEIVGPGITPGSGPGHLALFGYDPLAYPIGRGVLSALGIDFALRKGGVAARVNFATVNDQGLITDRRAGRIDTEVNRRLCDKLKDNISLSVDGEFFFEPVSKHRAVFILRGAGLSGHVRDTDPQTTGTAALAPKTLDVATFDEYACSRGMLGLRPAMHLIGLALAHARRLKKYGA